MFTLYHKVLSSKRQACLLFLDLICYTCGSLASMAPKVEKILSIEVELGRRRSNIIANLNSLIDKLTLLLYYYYINNNIFSSVSKFNMYKFVDQCNNF